MRTKCPIEITAEAFSIHTIELCCHPTMKELHRTIDRLFDLSRKTAHKGMFLLPTKQASSKTYSCLLFTDQGVRLYLSILNSNDVPRAYVKTFVNPRKLLDSSSSYLGIMPLDEQSFIRFAENFTDLMRTIGLPEFLADWQLNRCDLCVNLQFGKNKVARELMAALRKNTPSGKFKQKHYMDSSLSPQILKEKRKHYLCYATDSVRLVVYDKMYQLTENRLILAQEKLPNGVLRVELQCRKKFLNAQAKKLDCDTNAHALLRNMQQNSAYYILKYVKKCFCSGMQYTPDALFQVLEAAKIRDQLKQPMLALCKSLRYVSLDQAIKTVQKQYQLSEQNIRRILKKFQKLGICPIPLRTRYFRASLPSLPDLLDALQQSESIWLD